MSQGNQRHSRRMSKYLHHLVSLTCLHDKPCQYDNIKIVQSKVRKNIGTVALPSQRRYYERVLILYFIRVYWALDTLKANSWNSSGPRWKMQQKRCRLPISKPSENDSQLCIYRWALLWRRKEEETCNGLENAKSSRMSYQQPATNKC